MKTRSNPDSSCIGRLLSGPSKPAINPRVKHISTGQASEYDVIAYSRTSQIYSTLPYLWTFLHMLLIEDDTALGCFNSAS